MSTIAHVHISMDKALYAEVKHYMVDHDLKVSALVESAIRRYMQPVSEPKDLVTASMLKHVATVVGGDELFERYRKFRNSNGLECIEAYRVIMEKGLDVLESKPDRPGGEA